MFKQQLILFFGIFICGVTGQYYYVTAPNVVRFEHDETFVVGVFGLQNAAVKVWFEHGDKAFSERTVVVQNQEKPRTETLKVTEDDLFDEEVEEKPRTIKICSEWNGETRKRDVILSYQTGYLIVQTDKPIYTPQQEVNVRVLALDESLQAAKEWQVSMDVMSPSNLTVARKTSKENPNGFFENKFTLPPFPELGVWTARAFYRGQYETQARAYFQVDKYVLPTFEVTVDVDTPYILEDTDDIKVTVRAKYVYNKPVEGNARLTLNLKDKMGSSEYLLDMGRTELETNFDSNEGSSQEFSISVQEDIMRSPPLSGKLLPVGSRLEIVAVVYEHATGKEEAVTHEETVFAKNPFEFKFTRSKDTFRPGWEFYLKVDMLHANGEPATSENIRLQMFAKGQLVKTKDVVTDKKGQSVATFGTNEEVGESITFKVSTADGKQESEDFIVKAYEGSKTIQVERAITDDDSMVMRAFSNIQGADDYTGIMFMVVTRGKVVSTVYKAPANLVSEPINEQLQELVSPSARLLAFYVDKKSKQIVADSIKFNVEAKCRGKGLTLETIQKQLKPGKTDMLTITGSPNMWVGLNVMDKALLLLNNKNVLRKSKMFEVLESHDLGCGEGSGINSADVFKKSGMTILTNADISDGDIEHTTDACEPKKRRKRDIDERYGSEYTLCSDEGYEYAELMFYEAEYPATMDPYFTCYSIAREYARNDTLSTMCIMAFLETCCIELEYMITENTGIMSKSLDDISEFQSDLARLAEANVKPHRRTDFKESWLFEIIQLDNDGVGKKKLPFPDSITEWSIQSIGITSDMGMCIAEPIDFLIYRDFFVQLDLPYKAVRLEHFDVKATIFSYGLPGDKPKSVNVYLEGVDDLCYNSKSGKASPKTHLELPPNSAQTVRFPMIPLKAGQFPVTVTAIVFDVGIPEVDIITKKLLVVNEGIEENININICLDPNDQMNDCENDARVISDVKNDNNLEPERVLKIDLTLPKNSIPQTGSATAYLQSNIMDNVVRIIIEGVDSLLRIPSGCGEQTMLGLAPTVYAMNYLKETKQVTDDIEVKGNQWIRDGVTREVSQYRHPDGSYAAWQSRPSSTWLTAFVAKVLCQAKTVVDDAVDEQKDIAVTIDWLKSNVGHDGSFIDHQPVIHREMIGQMNERDPSLTAFVLISLLECNIKMHGVDATIESATQYLENLDRNLFRQNHYILALSTYALAKANSKRKREFKELLLEASNEQGKNMYWGNPGGYPASASSVETTAYALLALMEFDDFATSARVVRWLTSQRDAKGAFRTTQDTVVGLQALSVYSIKTYSPDVDLEVELLADEWRGEQISVTKENSVVQKIVKNLPVEHGNNDLTVKVTGKGTGRMMIDLRYNRPAEDDEICPFDEPSIEVTDASAVDIDVNLAKERNCDVCGNCDDPDYVDYDNAFGNPVEVEPKINSNFGRRKRRAERDIRVTKSKKCIRFSVRSRSEKEFGMSIVNFGLETGVEVVESDLKKLLGDEENPTNIARYEMPSNQKGFVILYLEKVTQEGTNITFRLMDNFDGDVNSRQPSSLTIYDYYNPDQKCTHIYGTGPSRGQSFEFECKKDQKQCQCLQSMCVQPVEEEIKRRIKSRQRGRRPAVLLYRYTCNPEKANYAVVVKIEHIDFDPKKGHKTARGVVLSAIHQGKENLQKDDEMSFFWKMTCDHPDLKKGQTYIIIGRDGNKFKTEDDQEEFRYPLMGTTLVIKDIKARNPLGKVLANYKKLMLKGCMH